jgi:WXG100 family type VII secretion target
MARRVQLRYDELRAMVKQFRDEGEDIAKLQVKTLDRVRDLHKDWEGEGSEKFSKEMENDLLPALSRLSKALFFAQDTLQRIIKIIHDHDEDTKGFFRGDFTHTGRERPGALGAAAAANSWERMNQLGVWDANRKEFVYPDNQLQPEQPEDAKGGTGGLSGSSDSAGRLMIANEFTDEVDFVDVTTGDTTGPVTPHSSDEKKSNDENGYLPKVTTVEVER